MNKEIEIEKSSGNVFADLDYHNPDEALAKSRLAQRISELIEQQAITQIEAAKLLKIDQSKFSKLMHGQLREFSIDRLFRFLNALNQNIEIIIKEKPHTQRQATLNISSRL